MLAAGVHAEVLVEDLTAAGLPPPGSDGANSRGLAGLELSRFLLCKVIFS